MAHKRGAQPKPLLPSLVYAPPPPYPLLRGGASFRRITLPVVAGG